MEDRDFFDTMYQGWSKTTGAENMFWMPEEVEATEHHARNGQIYPVPGSFSIHAVDQNDTRTIVATNLSEEDAAFITAIHGCYGDLTRRLHMALDEADRLDEQADEREGRIAELTLRVMELEVENAEQREMLEEVGR